MSEMEAKEDLLRALRTQQTACEVHGWFGISGVIEQAIKYIEETKPMASTKFVKIPLDGGRTFECWIPENATHEELLSFVGHLMTLAGDYNPSMAWAHWRSVKDAALGKPTEPESN